MKKLIATALLLVGFLVSVPNAEAQYRQERFNIPVVQCWYERVSYNRYQRVCRTYKNHGQWRRDQNRGNRFERVYDRRNRRYDYRPVFQIRLNF